MRQILTVIFALSLWVLLGWMVLCAVGRIGREMEEANDHLEELDALERLWEAS